MKRFALFGYPDYEALGGMNDFIDDFSTLKLCTEFIDSRNFNLLCDKIEIWDMNKYNRVKTFIRKGDEFILEIS